MTELKHPDARFLFATAPDSPASSEGESKDPSPTGALLGFVHFRFEMAPHIINEDGDSEEVPILYLYELQIDSSVQRKGLGRFLCQLVELVALKMQMAKIVLTVFKENVPGLQFYKAKMKYLKDGDDPSYWNAEDEYPYEILSKLLPAGKAVQDAAAAAAKK